MSSTNSTAKLYQSVIDDVMTNVRNAFIEEGGDDQLLMDLKQLWMKKLEETKAVEAAPPVPDAVQLVQALSNQQRQSIPLNRVINLQSSQVQQYIQLANSANGGQIKFISIPGNSISGADGQKTMNAPKTTYILPQGQNLAGFQAGGSNAPQHLTFSAPNQNQQWIQTKEGNIHLQQVSSVPQNTTIITPAQLAAFQQQAQNQNIAPQSKYQFDGSGAATSSEDEEDDGEVDEDEEEEAEEDLGDPEDPLNSADDISDVEPEEIFDIDNVVVCQYEKVNHTRNRWKFQLKDGIMNIEGKDYAFLKANGEAEW